MNFAYRFKKYLWLVVLGIASLPFFSSCVNADKLPVKGETARGGSPVPEGATCYLVGPDIDQPLTADDIRKKLDLLEQQYLNGKINKKTYETQKKNYLETLEAMGAKVLRQKSNKKMLDVKFKMLEKQYENKEIDLKTYRRKNNLLLTEKAYYLHFDTVDFKHPVLIQLRARIQSDPKNAEKYENQLLDELNKLLD